jgi:hypothetical protein
MPENNNEYCIIVTMSFTIMINVFYHFTITVVCDQLPRFVCFKQLFIIQFIDNFFFKGMYFIKGIAVFYAVEIRDNSVDNTFELFLLTPLCIEQIMVILYITIFR